MKIVEHHTKYEEVHGIDESTFLSVSEHRKLHNRLRREGRCTIPSEELNKISKAAYHRTEKGRELERRLNKSYREKYLRRMLSVETIVPNVQLHETISYNLKTGSVGVQSGFHIVHTKREVIHFTDTIAPNIHLVESLVYDTRVGNIFWRSSFSANHDKELYRVDI